MGVFAVYKHRCKTLLHCCLATRTQPSPADRGATVAGAKTTVTFRAGGDEDAQEPRVLSVSLTFDQLREHAVVCAFSLRPCDDFGSTPCCRPPPSPTLCLCFL
jgi:hypothetical protein